MPTRTRTRSQWRQRGYCKWHDVETSPSTGFDYVSETCVDEVYEGDNHPFSVTRFTSEGGLMSTTGGSGGITPICVDYTIDQMMRTYPSAWAWPSLGTLSNSVYATKAAARTNPSRPIVDVPALLLELGDLALLLKNTIGDGVIKGAARNNLRYQFGINPLVSDIVKLINFNEHVERRVKVIKKLIDTTGYRRTVLLDKRSACDWSDYIQVQSNPNTYNDRYERRVTSEVKGHVRWKPTHAPTHLLSPEVQRSLARRAVLGIGRGRVSFDTLASLYEAMPWSWLIDWCTTLGDYLSIQRNVIPATLSSVTIIKDTRRHARLPRQTGTVAEGVTFVTTEGHYIREERTRTPVVPSLPTAHFPFLSGSQMGIVASLYIAKARR